MNTNPEEETALLAISEVCADKITALYHSGLFAGHQGVIKTYSTIADKFFISALMHYLHSYIKGCHICQLFKKDKTPTRQFQARKLEIYHTRSEKVGDVLIDNVISKYGLPEYIIMYQDSAFISTLMSYLFKRFNIKIKIFAPYNHQSLQVEHGIKLLSTILTKHLTEQGQMWPKFLPLATLAYNTFNAPNLANYSPYELLFGRKPKILLVIETDSDIKVSGSFKDYHTLLNKRLKYLQNMMQQFKSKHLAMIKKTMKIFNIKVEICYILYLL